MNDIDRLAFLLSVAVALFICLCVSGCTSPALANIDRDYAGFYDASSGRGGVKVKWSPAQVTGKGKPTVGMEIDFKQTVEAMDFR